MARTIVGVNDAKAVKKWAGLLAYDTSQKSYFNQRFMARGSEAEVPIQILTDLESDAGEQVSYDLLAELKMAPVEGEDILEGKEEGQKFYTDQIYIDQARAGVNTGGRMTRKRTLHDLREKAKRQQSSWWARLMDELLFIYLSGARGINSNFLLPAGYSGRANNGLVTPDANHVLYGDNATAFNNIDSADKFDLRLIDRAKTKADAQGGGATDIPVLQPCKIDGNETFVCVMHTFQEDDHAAIPTPGNGWTFRRHPQQQKAAIRRCSRVRSACIAVVFCTRTAMQSASTMQVLVPTWKRLAACSLVLRPQWWHLARQGLTCATTGMRKPATTATRWSFLPVQFLVSKRSRSTQRLVRRTLACSRWIPLRLLANQQIAN